mgnify:CR=1 FL=1
MSNPSDVTGQLRMEKRKERRKSILPAGIFLGHRLKKSMTVICIRWGAIGKTVIPTTGR